MDFYIYYAFHSGTVLILVLLGIRHIYSAVAIYARAGLLLSIILGKCMNLIVSGIKWQLQGNLTNHE